MEDEKNELEFYSKFAKPLIFTLPEAQDRVLAASWAKKIKDDENTNDKLKADYIKLLLFALQRKKLVGIFTDDPTKYETLAEFPDEYDLNAMAQELIETEQKERRSKIRRQLRGQMGDFPPYSTDISSDLREYAAAQDIPFFGVHCYYAISKEPVTSWHNSDKAVIPPIIMVVDPNSPIPPGNRGEEFETEETKPSTSGSPSDQQEPEKVKKKPKRKYGSTPPVKPLVEKYQPEEDERKPPTWSSNLIDVTERTRSTGIKPKLRFQLQQQKEKEHLDEVDFEIEEDYKEMGRALKDFQRGEIREQKRQREKRSKADDLDMEEEPEEKEKEHVVVKGSEENLENFADLNETEYEQELKEDSLLVQYFKDNINKRMIQKEKDVLKDTMRGTIPAQSGIPLTTPKPSVSPKRLKTVPPIYAFDEPLPADITQQPDSTCSYVCSGKDPDMDRIFQEASAIAKFIDDDLEADYSLLDKSQQTHKEEKVTFEDVPLPEPQAPPSQPIQRLLKGSPAAHKVFADVVPHLTEQLKPGETPTEYKDTSTAMPSMPATTKQEFDYIDSLFEKDKKSAKTIKTVSNIASDADRDQRPSHDVSTMPSSRSPKVCRDQQSPLPPTQPLTPSQQFEKDRPLSTSKITQSSTEITTSVPKYTETSQFGASYGSSAGNTLDFAKGYVPPVYKSPTGIGLESPPYFMSPGRGEAPSFKPATGPQAQAPRTAPSVEQRVDPSVKRRLFYNTMDTDTFIAESTARQKQNVPTIPPVAKDRMKFRGMDTDTFLAEATARQKDLPPLPPDFAPYQHVPTPPRTDPLAGWISPPRPLPVSRTAAPMLSMEKPPFFDSPRSPASPNLYDTSIGGQYMSPPSMSPGPSQQPSGRINAPTYFETPRSQATRPFVSPERQPIFDRGMTPPSYASPQSPQPTPPFVTPDFTSGNLFDTSFGDLYSSPPPASPTTPRGLQQMVGSPTTPRFQPCGAQRSMIGDQQSRRLASPQNVMPAPAGPSYPLDEYGLPSVVQVSPLSKFDEYERYYNKYPDLRTPPRAPGSQGAPPLKMPCPVSAPAPAPERRPMSFRGMDTDTFIQEARARQKDLPPLPPDDPLYAYGGTPPRRESPEKAWMKTPPSYNASQMLDAITTPPFYDSPGAQLTPPNVTPGRQNLPSPPAAPSSMSPGMQQMLNQLPQAQSFLGCKAKQSGSKSKIGGGQKLSKRPVQPSSALPPIAGSPSARGQSDGRDPGSQGGRVPGSQGGRVPASQGGRVPGSQGGRVPGPQGGRVPGPQGGRVPGPQGGRCPRGANTSQSQSRYGPNSNQSSRFNAKGSGRT